MSRIPARNMRTHIYCVVDLLSENLRSKLMSEGGRPSLRELREIYLNSFSLPAFVSERYGGALRGMRSSGGASNRSYVGSGILTTTALRFVPCDTRSHEVTEVCVPWWDPAVPSGIIIPLLQRVAVELATRRSRCFLRRWALGDREPAIQSGRAAWHGR
ncbi:MAG: hypothetical protein ACP5ID_05015 [Conexivisphaera sp.]